MHSDRLLGFGFFGGGGFCEKNIKAPTHQGAQGQAGMACKPSILFALRFSSFAGANPPLTGMFTLKKGSKTSAASDAEAHFQF